VPTDHRRPWERQEGESAKAYKAFATYRDLGPKRSLNAAYTKSRGVKGASKERRATGTWHRWAIEHHWVARATAYDDHVDAKARAEREAKWAERQAQVDDRAWESAEQLLGRAQEMLEFPLVEQRADRDGKTIVIKPSRWRLRDAEAFVSIADRLMRLATGKATDRSEHTGAGGGPIEVSSLPDLSHLSPEEASDLLRLIRKAKAGPEGSEE
jgi:hypothetical protein